MEKENTLICVYVLMYIGLPTLAFLSWSECGHHKETPIFQLETGGNGKFKRAVIYKARSVTSEMLIGEFILDTNFP